MAKPAFKVQAKSKKSDTRINVMAIWKNDDRYNATLDRDVVKIVAKLQDGRTVELTNDVAWFNVYDNRDDNEQNQEPNEPTSTAALHPDDADVPF